MHDILEHFYVFFIFCVGLLIFQNLGEYLRQIMSYLNQDPQEETCHEVMAKAKINMKKKIPYFRYEAHMILILSRLLLGCMTLFCGTLRELRQSCLLSTLRLPTPACTRFS